MYVDIIVFLCTVLSVNTQAQKAVGIAVI